MGDLVICEDASGVCRVVGVTPRGKYYMIAAGAKNGELAGACFSPDGTTLFVNVQTPGLTGRDQRSVGFTSAQSLIPRCGVGFPLFR